MTALGKLVHCPEPVNTHTRFVAFAVDLRDASPEDYPYSRLPADWDKKPLVESAPTAVSVLSRLSYLL
jgi:hypothetical protein